MNKLFIFGIIITILFGIFILNFIGGEDLTIKTFDEKTGEIIIKTGTIEKLSMELNTPTNNLVGGGYNKIAQFTINPKEDINSIIEKIELYNLKDNSKIIIREIDIKYLSIGTKNISDYKIECGKSKILENGTILENCSKVLSGSHFENEWLNFDGSIKTNELITIGLFTDVQVGDKIEWMPTIAGVKIEEWAVWEQSLNTNLISYYKFDVAVGDGGTVIDSIETHDGINSDAVNTTGKIGYSYTYNGVNPTTHINMSNMTDFTTNTNFTINCWIYPTDVTDRGGFVDKRPYGTTDVRPAWNFDISDNGARKIGFAMGDGAQQSLALGATSLNDNTWYMVTAIRNANINNVTVFLNSVVDGYEVVAGVIPQQSNGAALIGGENRNSATVNFKGKVDECGFWERALSQAEVTDLYNSGAGITYTVPDPCDCAGLNNDWEIELSDYCVISDDCDLGTGTLSFTGSGNFTCDAAIDTTNMGDVSKPKTEITFATWENDWEGWTDGGADTELSTTTSYCGSYSMQIEDDDSSYTEKAFDFSGHDNVYVNFTLNVTQRPDPGECLVLTCDGALITWWGGSSGCKINLASEQAWYNVSTIINSSACDFESNPVIRFQSNASAVTEYFYFDCMTLTGTGSTGILYVNDNCSITVD